MSDDSRIADLLRSGGTDRGIARELGVSPKAAARVRRHLGIPPRNGRPTNWPSLHAMIRALSEPAGGGHMRWAGPLDHGTPTALWKTRRNSVYRPAFTAHRDREPDGTVLPGCDYPQCVAPDHLQDRAMRQAVKKRSESTPTWHRSTPQATTTEGQMTTDDWRHGAVCREEDPELFFPIGNTGPAQAQAQQAKKVCQRCPSKNACLTWALDTNQEAGVWGGLSENERRSLKRRSARQRAAAREAA